MARQRECQKCKREQGRNQGAFNRYLSAETDCSERMKPKMGPTWGCDGTRLKGMSRGLRNQTAHIFGSTRTRSFVILYHEIRDP